MGCSLAAARAQTRDLLPEASAPRTETKEYDIRSNRAGRVTFVYPIPAANPAAASDPADLTADLTVHGVAPLFGVADVASNLSSEGAITDPLGRTTTTWRQMHRGVPVFSGILKTHQSSRGELIAANGLIHAVKTPLDVAPSRNDRYAADAIRAALRAPSAEVDVIELVVVDPGWYGDAPIGAHVAWHLVARSADFEMAAFVDAHSGEVLDVWSLRHDARDRRIFNGRTSTDLPGVPARFEGDRLYPVLRDVNRAYDYFGDTYDYFARAFGRDGIDGEGLPMIATVNSNRPNCANAFWSSSLLQMVFCEGTVTDDIVAHELMHGVTQFSANLIYQNQPGQLNESYSDIFGELVDLFNGDVAGGVASTSAAWPQHRTGPGLDQPNLARSECSLPEDGYPDGVRWLIGEDAFAFGGAIRDMWNPPCYNHPDTSTSSRQTCSVIDSGGVHSGSGIPNHAFAIMTDGKSFNGFDVRGIGPIKSGAVWYRALTTYLGIASDFEDAFAALNQSARDLVGTAPNDPRTGLPSGSVFTEDDALQVELALRAVELDQRGQCGWWIDVLDSAPAAPCANRTVPFSEDFESEPLGWVRYTRVPGKWQRAIESDAEAQGAFRPVWRTTREDLPFRRSGHAIFATNEGQTPCGAGANDSVRVLTSPDILAPMDAEHLFLSFDHYLECEPGWDGARVILELAESGTSHEVPMNSFIRNAHNAILRAKRSGNSNPLRGKAAWTGVGGQWGTSVIDLDGLVEPGTTFRLRFEFGEDRCVGIRGWFVDDVEVYACPDCDGSGSADVRDLVFSNHSGPLTPIGLDAPQTHVIEQAPLAGGDVSITIRATADLSFPNEFLTLSFGETELARLFERGGADCPLMPSTTTLHLTAAEFNERLLGGDAIFHIDAPLCDGCGSGESVSPLLCASGSWVSLEIHYRTTVADDDENGIPDVCE